MRKKMNNVRNAGGEHHAMQGRQKEEISRIVDMIPTIFFRSSQNIFPTTFIYENHQSV
jgi:hypothetical protein